MCVGRKEPPRRLGASGVPRLVGDYGRGPEGSPEPGKDTTAKKREASWGRESRSPDRSVPQWPSALASLSPDRASDQSILPRTTSAWGRDRRQVKSQPLRLDKAVQRAAEKLKKLELTPAPSQTNPKDEVMRTAMCAVPLHATALNLLRICA